MLWYKRYASLSVGREIFSISPLAHLIYTVASDMMARAGKGGTIRAEDLDSPEYLARMCNLRLASLEDIQHAILSDSKDRKAVLTGALTDPESLMGALSECVKVGLIKQKTVENESVYVIEGFTDDNPFFLPPETVKKRKQREIASVSGSVPGQYGDSPGTVPGKREKREREKERKKEKREKLVAKATGEKCAHKSLTDKLVEAYEQIRGSKYLHQKGKDGVAVKDLLSIATEEEILVRWRKGLNATGWHNVSTFAQLRQKWNDLSQTTVAKEQTTTIKAQRLPTYEEIKHLYEPDPEYLKKKKEMGPDWY